MRTLLPNAKKPNGWRTTKLYGVHVTSFNALYGALGGNMAFLMWIYLSSYVCAFGICYCAAQADERRNANSHPKNSSNDDA